MINYVSCLIEPDIIVYDIRLIRSQHPTTEPHGSVVGCWLRSQAVMGSNPALGYLVSPFRNEN